MAGAIRALRAVDDRISAAALRVIRRSRSRRTADRRWTCGLQDLRGQALPAHVLRRRDLAIPGGYIAVLVLTAGAWFIAHVPRRGVTGARRRPWFSTSARAGGCSAWPLSWSSATNRPGTCILPLSDGPSSSGGFSRSSGARRQAAVPLCDSGREHRPVGLLRGQPAGGSQGVGSQIGCRAESGRRPRARSTRGARRKPADCRRLGSQLGVGVALRRSTPFHPERSRRPGVHRFAGAARLLPGSMDGAHATRHPGLVAKAFRAPGGTPMGCSNRSVLAS